MINIFNQEQMYNRLKNNKYFNYLALKDNYEDTLIGITKEAQIEKSLKMVIFI